MAPNLLPLSVPSCAFLPDLNLNCRHILHISLISLRGFYLATQYSVGDIVSFSGLQLLADLWIMIMMDMIDDERETRPYDEIYFPCRRYAMPSEWCVVFRLCIYSVRMDSSVLNHSQSGYR